MQPLLFTKNPPPPARVALDHGLPLKAEALFAGFHRLERLHMATAWKEPVEVENTLDGSGLRIVEPETAQREQATPIGGRQGHCTVFRFQLPSPGKRHRIPAAETG